METARAYNDGSRLWMSETKTLIVSRVSDWWSRGVFLIYCWELPWRWFNKDLIRCLFSESRLKSHPSLSLSPCVSKYHNRKCWNSNKTQTGRRWRDDERQVMWDTLLRPKINSPAEIVTKYISIKIYFGHVTGQQFPIAVTMRHDTGLTPLIISIIMKCFMKCCSTPKITGTQTSCY